MKFDEENEKIYVSSEDMAKAKHISHDQVLEDWNNKVFDPGSIESVCRYILAGISPCPVCGQK